MKYIIISIREKNSWKQISRIELPENFMFPDRTIYPDNFIKWNLLFEFFEEISKESDSCWVVPS